MRIVEALKELRLTEKKVARNHKLIKEYSSGLDTEKPVFGSDSAQKQEVAALVQSSEDLAERYLFLKRCLSHTNLLVSVKIGGTERTIAEWLEIKRKIGGFYIFTYQSLSQESGERRRREGWGDRNPVVVQFYDEKEKNERLRYWQDLVEEIDGRLEVVNADTELIEP